MIMDIKKYTNEKPDYLSDFEDAEFGELYSKHITLKGTYLDGLAESILTEIMPDYTPEEFNNFKRWVFIFGHTIYKKERMAEKAISDAFKAKITEGMTVKLAFKTRNVFGGESNTPLTAYRVIKDCEGKLFILRPRCRNRGHYLDNVTLTALVLGNA